MTKIKLNAGNLVIALMFSLILFLIVIIVFIFYNRANINSFTGIPPITTGGSFSNCTQLAKSCNDNKCDYYNLCGVSSGFKNCQVYDCGKDYGVETVTMDGRTLARTYPKPDPKTAKDNIIACQGTVKILSDKCEKNIGKVNVEVLTKAACPPEAFIVRIGNQWQPAIFFKEADNRYSVVSACENIQELKVIGAKGLIIGSVSTEK